MNVQESIDNMMLVLKEYEKYQDDINLYLKLVDKQKEFVQSGKELLDYSAGKIDETVLNSVSDHIQKTKSLRNSDVLYNAIIISLYGNFERYVDDLLIGYVGYLGAENTQYDALPDNLRKKHIERAAEYLANEGRYKNLGLTQESVITQLFSCIVNNKTDSLPKEFFIRHGGNLKTDEINRLFESFGINNIGGSLKNTRSYYAFLHNVELDDPDDWKEILDSLVDQRNQVAHGRAENRIALSDLSGRYVPTLIAICKSLLEIIIEQILRGFYEKHKLIELNKIIHVWRNNIVGINVGNKHLFVGQRVVVKNGEDHFWMTKINVIKAANGRYIQKTKAFNKDVSIELDIDVKESYQLFLCDL